MRLLSLLGYENTMVARKFFVIPAMPFTCYNTKTLHVFFKKCLNLLLPAVVWSHLLMTSTSSYAEAAGLILGEDDSLIPPEQVSDKDIKEDINFLLPVFARGYGGYKVHPIELIKAVEKDFETIGLSGTTMPTKTFCKKIAAAFHRLPDSHLNASLPNFKCIEIEERKGRVGSNVLPVADRSNNRPWKLSRVRVDGLNVSVLGIIKFPPANDSSWHGFEETYKSLFKHPLIIIDLRGNQGGDDTRGFELANFLNGGPPPFNAEQRIMRRTPEAIVLRLNRFLLMRRKEKKPNVAINDSIRELQSLYDQAKSGSITQEVVDHLDHKRKRPGSNKKYSGKIYILGDADCGSSGESTLDALRSIQNAKFVGENTAGVLQFGNVGKIVLPRSKIQIQMGTQFVRYRDNQMVETVGFSPDIRVPPGNNALVWAIRHFNQSRRMPKP